MRTPEAGATADDGAYQDEDCLTFGKYAGTEIGKVPAGYLLWLWDNGLWDSHVRGADRDPVRLYIIKHFAALETECPDRIIQHRP